MKDPGYDVVGAEIHRKALHNLTNEMAIALRRTSGSPDMYSPCSAGWASGSR